MRGASTSATRCRCSNSSSNERAPLFPGPAPDGLGVAPGRLVARQVVRGVEPGEPQCTQNPRRTPGDEAKYVGFPAVKRNAFRGTEIQVAIGEDVARRQLSQWQWSVQFGASSYENATARQRQWPLIVFMEVCSAEFIQAPAHNEFPAPARRRVRIP